MSLAAVAAVVGAGAAIYSASQSGGGSIGGGGSTPYQYLPTGQGTADTTWQQMLQSLSGSAGASAGAISPELMQAYQQMMGVDPSGMTSAAQQAGAYTGNLAANEDQMHNLLIQQAGVNSGAQQNLMGAGNQLYQTSLDPQNALRNQLQQQVVDASRAGTSARGIGMSGNAAGIENNDVNNFLLQWQQQQLQNQATGLQGMTGAYAQAGQQGQNVGTNLSGAATMGGLAASNIAGAGSIPYQANLTAAGQPFNAANMYGQAQTGDVNSQYGGILSSIIPYLNFGSGAGQNAFGQNQQNLANLGYGANLLGQAGNSLYGSLGNLYGTQPPAQAPSNYGGGDTTDPYGGGYYPA